MRKILLKVIKLMSWTNIIDKFNTKVEQTPAKTWNEILAEVDTNTPKLEPLVTIKTVLTLQPAAQPAFEPDSPVNHPLKIDHTQGNYFKFGIDNKILTTKWDRPKEINVTTWRDQNKLAAKYLTDTFGEALTLFYDGTLESQAMLLAFNDAGVIPRVYALNIENQPKDEILEVLHSKLVFSLRMISLSADFWKRRSSEIALQHNIKNPISIKKIWASTAAAGIPILANGIPFIRRLSDKSIMIETQSNLALESNVEKNNLSVIPAFFRFTPEQIMAFLASAPAILEKNNAASSPECIFALLKDSYAELYANNDENIHSFEEMTSDIRCFHDIRPLN
jgi:hypothetical protein